jgi:DNA sulfur modification protein DndD
MKLARAAFEHFKILNNVEVDFGIADTNIFFLNGFNGRGKTSFQEALYWCLYDRAPEGGLANRSALKASTSNTIDVSVTLEFQLDDDEYESVEIRKSAEVKVENGLHKASKIRLAILGKSPGTSNFSVPIANEEEWLRNRFPAGLQQFFLFDGESLERFFVNTTKEKIKEAVREIAGVEAFEGIEEKLNVTINEWRRQLAKDSKKGSAESKEFERQKHKRLALDAQNAIYLADEGISRLESELDEIDQYLARFGNNSNLLQDEADLKNRIESLTSEITELRISQHNELLEEEGLQYALDKQFLEDVLHQQAEAIEKDEYPPHFSESLIRKILELGKCVCGEEITLGSEKSLALEKLIIEHRDVDAIGQDLQVLCAYADYWPKLAKSKFSAFNEQSKSITTLNKQLGDLKSELDAVQEKLVGADRDEQKQKVDRKKRIPFEISEIEVSRNAALGNLEWSNSQVATLDKEIEKLVKSSNTNEKFTRLIAMAESLIKAAKLAHKSAVESVRGKLEQAVDEEFRFVKSGSFKTHITDNFDVKTVTSSGEPASLSSGENMMKAYVFALALRKVIGFKFPLVVDTPFGRLDSVNRLALVNMITRLNASKELHEGNQVIFLMHDAEYTPAIKKAFEPNSPIEMYLSWVSEEDISQISAGIDPAWLTTDSWRGWVDNG